MDKEKERLQALKAITAFRQLDALVCLTEIEKMNIKGRLMAKYSEYLNPLRTTESE